MRRTPVVGLIAVSGMAGVALGEPESAEAVFASRILPIFRSENPSSCVECHLSGVDLKSYILPSSDATFLSLRDQGMVDLDDPGASEILRRIAMQPEAGSREAAAGAALIHERNRKAEYKAFAAWIEACCKDPKLRNAPRLAPAQHARPARPIAVIRHNRMDRVVDSFSRKIWALRFRCRDCHMRDGAKFEKHFEEHGEKMAWLDARGPEATMRNIVDRKLVDLDRPERSKLLLKPLNVIEHGGGKKMLLGDTDYWSFLSWIRDYANVVRDGYTSVDALPDRATRTGSEVWLRVERVPAAWLGRTGILTVHRPASTGRGWEDRPVALASFVARKNPRFGVFAQSYLMIESEKSDAPELANGSYRVRIHLDAAKRTDSDADAALTGTRLVAEADVRSAWQRGFRNATVIRGPTLRLTASADEAADAGP